MKNPCEKYNVKESCDQCGRFKQCAKYFSWFSSRWRQIKKSIIVRKWDEEAEETMWALWNEGKNPREIAIQMQRCPQQIASRLKENPLVMRTYRGEISVCSNEKCEWKCKIDGVVDYCPLAHCIKGER